MRNKNKDVLATLLRQKQADIVALLETDQIWLDNLELGEVYPYRVEIPRDFNSGLALYSRFKIEPEIKSDLGVGSWPLIIAEVELAPEESLVIALVHAPPPVSEFSYYLRKVILKRLATYVKSKNDRVLVVGDFNATPFVGDYRQFLGDPGFSNAMYGYGLKTSWNAHSTLLRFTIDHVLYKGDLQVESFQVMPDIGSDHWGYGVEFGW